MLTNAVAGVPPVAGNAVTALSRAVAWELMDVRAAWTSATVRLEGPQVATATKDKRMGTKEAMRTIWGKWNRSTGCCAKDG